ncbi:MAG: MaoC family dehydratase [Thermoplasmatota archaeon]
MAKRILDKGESVSYDFFVDEEMQLNFGKTFDDWTLLHYDDDYARDVAFERRPMQGALISCIIVKAIVMAFGDSTILKAHNLTFHKPIYPGNTITVKLNVDNNIRNKLVNVVTEVWIKDTLHYSGNTKIRVFEEI